MDDTRLIILVRLAQAGDKEAFGLLVGQFEGFVFATVYKRLRNSAEAADVTQDVFVRALRKLNQLREPERFVGWLKRIAVRLSINRAVRRPRESMQDPMTLTAFVGTPAEAGDDLERTEQAAQLRHGMQRLRRLDRETLQAFYFEGQSIQEMSDRFASPVGTIKRRLHTARNRLRETLQEAMSS